MSLETFTFLSILCSALVKTTGFDFEHCRPPGPLDLLCPTQNSPHRLDSAQFLVVKVLEAHHQLDVVIQVDRIVLNELLHELAGYPGLPENPGKFLLRSGST